MFSWIAGVIAASGPWGLFWLMALENVFPLLPSELILPMAGYDVARGTMSFAAAICAATAGSILGALPIYGLARGLGLARLERLAAHHGRWLSLSPDDVQRAGRWFKRWGFGAVLAGRTLPGVRGVICIPAGLARQSFASFLLALSLGSLSWSTLVLGAGYVLRSHFSQVAAWLNPVADGFLLLSVGFYVYRVVTLSRRSTKASS